jgi:hypothetical protein
VVFTGGTAHAAADVVIRTSVTPTEAWIGQRSLLNIEILGADGWAQIPDLPGIDISSAYVMRTDSQGVRLSETIGRTGYTGQRYQLSVYCQRPGRLEIPATPVTVIVKQWGFNAGETSYEQMTPPAVLVCKVPPGAEGLRDLVTTTSLEASQTWSSQPATAAPGDAVTRTVTLTATDVSAMAFPPMRHPEIDGVAVYPGQPSVDDTSNRGQLQGRREESVTYVFERPGTVALPDVVVNWWNPNNARLERVVLPGLELEVTGDVAPVEAGSEPELAAVEGSSDLLRTALLAVPILGLAVWLAGWLWRRSSQWRAARYESEPVYFRRARSAIRGGDPRAATAAIMAWLDRLDPGSRPAQLGGFLERYGDEASREEASALARSLVMNDQQVRARVLDRGLARARRRVLRARRRRARADRALPELNG